MVYGNIQYKSDIEMPEGGGGGGGGGGARGEGGGGEGGGGEKQLLKQHKYNKALATPPFNKIAMEKFQTIQIKIV